ncbi:MAG: response regulator [Rickettsiales bacterium]|nr:response regulator [Rickettsiales bacterium]
MSEKRKEYSVLLVDDSTLDRKLHSHMLMRSEEYLFDVKEVSGFDDVLSSLKNSQLPDIILLDLNLGNASGIDILLLLEGEGYEAPVILVTVEDSDKVAILAAQAGAEDYLVKGAFNAKHLVRRVVSAIERHKHRQHIQVLREDTQGKEASKQQLDFATLVSHEFRTPLAIIATSTQIMRRYPLVSEHKECQKHLAKIMRAVRHMDSMITSTMDFSRLETGKLAFAPAWFDFHALLENIIDDYQQLYPAYQIVFDGSAVPVRYFGDHRLCQEILENIFSNAVKYSSQENAIHCSSKSDADGAFGIIISDQGRGISANDLDHVGTRFFRGSNAKDSDGTGIGLYLARRFMQLHHGELSISSEEGRGTQVMLKFASSTLAEATNLQQQKQAGAA